MGRCRAGQGTLTVESALTLSIVAIEKRSSPPNIPHGERSPEQKEYDMRILEVAIAGIIAVGAQMLVVGAVLI